MFIKLNSSSSLCICFSSRVRLANTWLDLAPLTSLIIGIKFLLWRVFSKLEGGYHFIQNLHVDTEPTIVLVMLNWYIYIFFKKKKVDK
jgi:hypothetical protein